MSNLLIFTKLCPHGPVVSKGRDWIVVFQRLIHAEVLRLVALWHIITAHIRGVGGGEERGGGMVASVVDRVVSPVQLKIIDSIITRSVGHSHLDFIPHIATIHFSESTQHFKFYFRLSTII